MDTTQKITTGSRVLVLFSGARELARVDDIVHTDGGVAYDLTLLGRHSGAQYFAGVDEITPAPAR